MATVLDIVTRAFRKIGVSANDENLTADQVSEGVDALNDMMHAWALRGVDIVHNDVTSTSEFPLDEAFREGTIYLLAARLAPNYEIPAAFSADEWFDDMRRYYMSVDPVTMPTALTRMPSRYWRNSRIR